jgi:predicted anti-sigma-YlaC factor YlaD
MNECARIEQSMGRWLDGELSAAESEVVRAHVSGCAHCGTAQQRLEKLERALDDVLVAAAPRIEFAPFWRELERRIDEKPPWHKELRERIYGWFALPRAAWAIPALIVVLLAALSYDSYFPFWRSRNNLATVVSIDSHGRSVALLREDESKTTVIWLYQNQEGDDEAAEETPQPGPAF